MMKLKFHLLLCFFATTFIFAQSNSSGIIHYESKINSKKLGEYLTNKRDKLKHQGAGVIKMLDKTFLNTKSIKSQLTFFNGKGLFRVEDKLNIDEHDIGQKINRINAGGSKIFYYQSKSKTFLIKNCETLGECFRITNNFKSWTLTQESKEINGFLSYKAIRKKGKIIAWYTPSIPISFGPKGESGLPGLILELEIGKVIFNATKIVLNPTEKVIIKEPTGGEKITEEEYKKRVSKIREQIFGKKKK